MARKEDRQEAREEVANPIPAEPEAMGKVPASPTEGPAGDQPTGIRTRKGTKMKKLGILIAITAAATLGFSGSASAQAEPICDGVFGEIANQAENHPFAGQDPATTPGDPVTSVAKGAQDSCNESAKAGAPVLDPLVCGVAEGVDGRLAMLGDAPVSLKDDVLGGMTDAGLPIKCSAAPDSTGSTNGTTPASGGSVSPTVQAANAAVDGGLPRTGGELFAGAGFALMSLGALVRRFLP